MTESERLARYEAAKNYRLTDDCVNTLLDNIAPGPGEARQYEPPAVRAKRLENDRVRKRARHPR